MTDIDELLAQIPLEQVASQLGVDEGEAERLTRQALPALLGGMEANAQDSGGAASLAAALGQHDNDLFDGGVDLGQVDTDDGAKIVRHVFGDNEEQVVRRLGGSGGDSGLMGKLLPMLAPIVMTFLAKKLLGGKSSGTSTSSGGGDSLGGLGDLLGGLLGGGSGGGGLGDLLGGLLGGGSRR